VAGIFNGSIFNRAIFNTEDVAPPAAAAPAPSGGWNYDPFPDRFRRRIEEIKVPERVDKAIQKVARKEVNDELEVAAEAALHREIDKLRLSYKAKYTELLRLHIAAMKARQDDDELALMLLLH
jgi:hypothetical protein